MALAKLWFTSELKIDTDSTRLLYMVLKFLDEIFLDLAIRKNFRRIISGWYTRQLVANKRK